MAGCAHDSGLLAPPAQHAGDIAGQAARKTGPGAVSRLQSGTHGAHHLLRVVGESGSLRCTHGCHEIGVVLAMISQVLAVAHDIGLRTVPREVGLEVECAIDPVKEFHHAFRRCSLELAKCKGTYASLIY